jgi:hypothetical protein
MNTNNELFPEYLETSSHIENDESSIECVMQEKARNSLRYVNNTSFKQHVYGLAKKRKILAKKEKSKAILKKQSKFKKMLHSDTTEQLLDSAAA